MSIGNLQVDPLFLSNPSFVFKQPQLKKSSSIQRYYKYSF